MSELETGIAAILAERGKTHGEYSEHARITQNIKGIMLDTGGVSNWQRLNAIQRESLEMIAHKIGRILAGDPNVRDHWVDIAGYAQLVADRV